MLEGFHMARKLLMGALAAAVAVWVFNAVGSSLPRLNSRSGGWSSPWRSSL